MKLLNLRSLEEAYKKDQALLEQAHTTTCRQHISDFVNDLEDIGWATLWQGKISGNNDREFFDWMKVGYGHYGSEPLYGFTSEYHRKYCNTLGAPSSYLDVEHTVYEIRNKKVLKALEKLKTQERIWAISSLAGGFPHNARPIISKLEDAFDRVLLINVWDNRTVAGHNDLFKREEALEFVHRVGFLNPAVTKYSKDSSVGSTTQ